MTTTTMIDEANVLENLDCYGVTDRGKTRDSNQDQFLIADLIKTMQISDTSLDVHDHTRLSGRSQGKLLLVADGMGGHVGGERASVLALETLNRYVLDTMHWFFRLEADRERDFEDDLKAALTECDAKVRAESESRTDRYRMGTTLTMAYLIWPRMYVVHVGDSRCYLLRRGQMRQITTDHTVAQQFLENGVLNPDEAAGSRWSHMLWNYVGGGDSELRPVVYKSELEIGDTLLLCSDGLTRHVANDQLAQLLAVPGSAADTCRRLVNAANDGGGSDNITVVAAHFRGDG